MNAAAQRRLTAPLAATVLLLGLLFLLFLAGVGRGVHWAVPRKPAPLHPNAAGMRAVADLVVAAATG
jgi:general secretion pathway protein N